MAIQDTFHFLVKRLGLLSLYQEILKGEFFLLIKEPFQSFFLRAARRAKVDDVHFHDLRHMALTKMSVKITNILELASISGHKELKMLQRYVHIKAEDLVIKMG